MKYQNTEFIKSKHNISTLIYFRPKDSLWSAYLHFEDEEPEILSIINVQIKFIQFENFVLSIPIIYYLITYMNKDTNNKIIWFFESEEAIKDSINKYMIENIHNS